MTGRVPLHAERTADPRTVRWVANLLATRCLEASGEDLQAALSRSGASVTAVVVGAGWVDVTAAAEQDWRGIGSNVRAVLTDRVAGAVERHGSDDEVLERVARAVLDEQVGELARSHGGGLEVLGVCDGVVTVGRRGACGHCPAAAVTVNRRFEQALRERAPAVREVRSVTSASARGRRRPSVLLPSPPSR